MKLASLRTEHTFRSDEFERSSHVTLEHFTKPVAAPQQIHTYTELLQQIHDDLRIQHPEWIQPNGESPICDSYEARLMELLDTLTKKSDESTAAPPHILEHGLNRINIAAAAA